MDDVDFSVDDVHSALTLAFDFVNADGTDEPWNGHPRSLKVIRVVPLWLALNSNLPVTSIFNRSWNITPNLHNHTPPFFQMQLKKDGWE